MDDRTVADFNFLRYDIILFSSIGFIVRLIHKFEQHRFQNSLLMVKSLRDKVIYCPTGKMVRWSV